MDELDEFCVSVQYDMDKQVEKQYGKEVLKVWQNLKYFNTLEKGDGEGKVTGSCRDTVEIFIKVEGDKIVDISYWTDGCVATAVCGCVVCELALGMSLEDAEKISGEDVLSRFPKMPDNHKHCAYLAANTLHEAIGDYYKRQSKKQAN